jgi:hypothetical protein
MAEIKKARSPEGEGDWSTVVKTAVNVLADVEKVNGWCISIMARELLALEGIEAENDKTP